MTIVTGTGDHGLKHELQQAGVLPWRIRKDGAARILLVTAHGHDRWTVPKGCPAHGYPSPAAASRGAFEEAGVIGDVSPTPVTAYRYLKFLDDGSQVLCGVAVFGMTVRGTLIDWRDKGRMQRRWFSPQAAADTLGGEIAAFITASGPGRLGPPGGRRPWFEERSPAAG